MSKRKNVDFGTVLERSKCLNAKPESMKIDSAKRFKILKSQLESCKGSSQLSYTVEKSLESYMDSIANLENANRYGLQFFYIVQELNQIDPKRSNQLIQEFTKSILPYIENLGLVSESVHRYDLLPEQTDQILESAATYLAADRILLNHNKISERFNILQEVEKTKGLGLREVVNRCCSMIDTYTIPPYAKMNLCLEEITYLLNRSGISYDQKDFIKYVTEYFLLRDANISDKEMKGYQFVLKENCMIKDQDTEKVSYLLNPPDPNAAPSIQSGIQRFLGNPNKSLQKLSDLINEVVDKTSVFDILKNLDNLLWLLWEVYRSDIFEEAYNLDYDISVMLDQVVKKFTDTVDYLGLKGKRQMLCYEDIEKMIEKIKEVQRLIKCGAERESYEYCLKRANFSKILDDFDKKLKAIQGIVFTYRVNAEAADFVNSEHENLPAIPLQEYKIFKFHNLVRACMNLDKYLKYKAQKVYTKGKNKTKLVVKKMKDILFGESVDIYSCIGVDAKADICRLQILFSEEAELDIKAFAEEVCKEFNSKLTCENLDSIRCYYIMNPGIMEIHLKEATPIILDDNEWKLVRESYNETFDLYVDLFAQEAVCLESIEDLSKKHEISIESALNDILTCENLSVEAYEAILEALSLLDVEVDTVKLFTESYNNARYSNAVLESVITEQEYREENRKKEKIESNWTATSQVPLDIQIEAYQCLLAISEAIKKPEVKKPKVGVTKKTPTTQSKPKDDPDTKVDESRKNPFKGINLNNIRLYLQGLKTKAKDMSTKEKEISRNLDNGFRRFVKAMKNALISDRREAIIKGSVIPSFSKCLKIAIGIAGLGVFAGPGVALIAALGSFAVSKRLTKKERILLLDEIETELDVVDKEIALAENRNQLKKYRVLLKYKKDLQRQYQRIRYNVRVGKDILPGSTTGVPGND